MPTTRRPVTRGTAVALGLALALAGLGSASASAAAPAPVVEGAPGATSAGSSAAGASAALAASAGFYRPPATIPGTPGTVIRSEPMTFYLDPTKLLPAPATATRVMYASTDRTGTPIAVTGTVLVPRAPWLGIGPRPLVAYAVGTQGLGDTCAPSRQLAAGSEYEGAFVSGLLTRGYAVVATDYQGLGTPGLHTYVNSHVEGTAVLDSARAAERLAGTGLSAATPVAVTGYSQGGGAAAAAAELAPTYAPDLAIKGVVAGAVPADLAAVGANLDGGLYEAFLLYAVDGLAAGYDVPLGSFLNGRGKQVAREIKTQCTFESIAKYPFVQSSSLSKDGRPLTAYLAQEPFKSIVADNRLGEVAPVAVPVMVTQSLLDDVIPFAVGRDFARRWCDHGANVRFSPNLGPTHIGGAVPSFADQFLFLEQRFAGLPQTSTCGTF